MAAPSGQSLKGVFPEEEDAVRFGSRLGGVLEPGTIVYLKGPLGAGKTTLVRAILCARGFRGRVKSPTYTLVESYPGVAHFDLYRLADPGELEWLGLRDYLDGENICLIEWPEKGIGFLPSPDLEIDLEPEGRERRVTLTAHSKRGEQILKRLSQI